MPTRLKPPTKIEGKRIILIARDENQAEELFSIIDNNREQLSTWMPWERTTLKIEDSMEYLKLTKTWWENGTTFDFSIFEKVSNRMIGSFGIHSINWNKKSCEFGYWIVKEFEGKGLITEAIELAEKMAKSLGIHRVLITCDRLNIKSQNVPKRNKYILESKIIDESINHFGAPRDTLCFVKFLNQNIDNHITENLPYGYSVVASTTEKFWELVESKMKEVFSNDLILNLNDTYSDIEKQNLAKLSSDYKIPYAYYLVLLYNGSLAGWSWGYQDSRESFYMVNSAIVPEHRGRNLYSRLLEIMLKNLSEKGFQRIWSRHNNTNNEIIIPKLKKGFQITGTELSDKFGSLVHLTYFTNQTRKKVLNFRSGHERPDPELKKLFDL